MARYTTTISVPTSVEDTFAYLSRFSTTQEWDPGVVEATDLGEGEPRVGSRYRVVAVAGGRRSELVYEITELDAPHRVVLLADNGRFRSHDTIECEPAPDGGTLVQYDAELTMGGLARFADPLLGLAFRRIGDRAAAGLAATLQARDAGDASAGEAA